MCVWEVGACSNAPGGFGWGWGGSGYAAEGWGWIYNAREKKKPWPHGHPEKKSILAAAATALNRQRIVSQKFIFSLPSLYLCRWGKENTTGSDAFLGVGVEIIISSLFLSFSFFLLWQVFSFRSGVIKKHFPFWKEEKKTVVASVGGAAKLETPVSETEQKKIFCVGIFLGGNVMLELHSCLSSSWRGCEEKEEGTPHTSTSPACSSFSFPQNWEQRAFFCCAQICFWKIFILP